LAKYDWQSSKIPNECCEINSAKQNMCTQLVQKTPKMGIRESESTNDLHQRPQQ